jgi:hypothetical protein
MKTGNVNMHQTLYLHNILGLKFEVKFDVLILIFACYRLYWLHQGLKYPMIFLLLWLCWLTIRPILRLAGETATVGEKFVS